MGGLSVKKITAVLMTALMLLALCACKSADKPDETLPEAPGSEAAQPADTVPAPPSPADAAPEPVQTPDAGEPADEAEEEYPGELNDYGLPDLSCYTAEEIWDMLQHPEDYDSAVLDQCDSGFEWDEDAPPHYDEEFSADYVADLGQWQDYDPGDWVPGPDEKADVEFDAGQFSGEGESADGGMPDTSDLPEELDFLLPDGLREGDFTIEENGTQILNLMDRTRDDYNDMVQRAKDAGFTIDPHELDLYGALMYGASQVRGSTLRSVTIMYQDGAIMVTYE